MPRPAPSAAQQARNRLGGITRANPARAGEARRELTKTVLRDDIAKAVAAWPPLTPEDRAELAVLLLSPAPDNGR